MIILTDEVSSTINQKIYFYHHGAPYNGVIVSKLVLNINNNRELID